VKQCEVLWLIAGRGQEWGVDEIEMAVAADPSMNLLRKRMAIFKQMNAEGQCAVPGPTIRGNSGARRDAQSAPARFITSLGLAEYESIEGFLEVEWRT